VNIYMKFLGLFFLLGFTIQAQSLPQIIQPNNEGLRYIGRFTDDYRCAWTGNSIEFSFTGTALNAQFSVAGKKKIAVTAVVDGVERILYLKGEKQTYAVAEGLPKGQHKVLLFRRSEASFGVLKFEGLQLEEDAVLEATEAPKRKILVIGDSITCGFANEGKSLKEQNTAENENGYMSYAAIASRSLNADLMFTSWSGKGMYRNGNNTTKNTLPQLFDYILPLKKEGVWDHSRYVPDVIVINLGTNDMRKTSGPLGKENYCSIYVSFLERLQKIAPNAKIIISIGPMGFDPVKSWLPEIAAKFKNTSPFLFSHYKSADEKAGLYHPSVKKDKLMAAELAEEIKRVTGWE